VSKYKPHAIFNPYRCQLYIVEGAKGLAMLEGEKIYLLQNSTHVPLEQFKPQDSSSGTFIVHSPHKELDKIRARWCAILYTRAYPWLSANISRTARMVRVYLAKKHDRHYEWETVRNWLQAEIPDHFPKRRRGRPTKTL
jgi:hypothetical protein